MVYVCGVGEKQERKRKKWGARVWWGKMGEGKEKNQKGQGKKKKQKGEEKKIVLLFIDYKVQNCK